MMEEGKEKVKVVIVAKACCRLLMLYEMRRILEEELRITGKEWWSSKNWVALLHLSTHIDVTLSS